MANAPQKAPLHKWTEIRPEDKTAYLEALIQNSPLAFMAADANQRVLLCNRSFVGLFQYDQSEVLGANPDELLAPGELATEAAELSRRAACGEAVQMSGRRRRKDGVLLDVEIYAVPLIVGGQIVGTYAFYQDTTSRKLLEEQFRQAQKMEAIGRLAGGVAHDFNNLLGVILGYSELMLDRLSPSDPLHKQAVEIGNAAERATSLTRQLLAFSRKQLLQPKVLDLNIIVVDIVEILRRLIGEDIELSVQLATELGRVKADRGQIEQVIMNLAVNARDAMPQGGKLIIETANVQLDETYVPNHCAVTPGFYVMLAVSDTGAGIDSENRAHIFEPFFTTKEGGTGLGLATVYGIVKQSGGYIWVYSEKGHGTIFKTYLPRVEDPVEPVEPIQVQTRTVRNSETILLVEDAEPLREVARAFLETSGYQVLAAADGGEALATAERHRGPIHLLMTDVVMPGMSGVELAERLKNLYPEMKVLYVSGYTLSAISHRGVSEPGVSLLQKPFGREALLRKVRHVLDLGKLK